MGYISQQNLSPPPFLSPILFKSENLGIGTRVCELWKGDLKDLVLGNPQNKLFSRDG
ncbi:hypothetical protein Sjap_018249 [Stephania japonica]|uniref:Uncharacterized protein n=1 Tax=Stephania japonica TaxID=461633 RepID=A0AAP0I7L8_9MAGN